MSKSQKKYAKRNPGTVPISAYIATLIEAERDLYYRIKFGNGLKKRR